MYTLLIQFIWLSHLRQHNVHNSWNQFEKYGYNEMGKSVGLQARFAQLKYIEKCRDE